MVSTTLDDQGRVAIPEEMRTRLGLEPGDTLFVWVNERTGHIELSSALFAFDALHDHTLAEYRAGQTITLREFAAAEGIDLEIVEA